MSSIHSYHVYIYIYVCVPYNIPDRINQTNVYTNLYVKATQHFELNFIVLYIYIYTSLSCVFVSNASKPHPFVKGHMAISYFQRPLRSCKVFKSQLATYFFQMPLRQCHFVKGHVAIFSKATWAMHTPSRSPWAQVQLQRAGGAPAGHQGGATHLLHSVCRTRP